MRKTTFHKCCSIFFCFAQSFLSISCDQVGDFFGKKKRVCRLQGCRRDRLVLILPSFLRQEEEEDFPKPYMVLLVLLLLLLRIRTLDPNIVYAHLGGPCLRTLFFSGAPDRPGKKKKAIEISLLQSLPPVSGGSQKKGRSGHRPASGKGGQQNLPIKIQQEKPLEQLNGRKFPPSFRMPPPPPFKVC